MQIARVVPDIPNLEVDRTFDYGVPESLRDVVKVGSLVRIPLGPRRARGVVVAPGAPRADLRDLAGVAGDVPVFDPGDLPFYEWVAAYYVAPLALVLRRALPPTAPRAGRARLRAARAAVAREGPPPVRGEYILTPPTGDQAALAAAEAERLTALGQVLVACPTIDMADEVARRLGPAAVLLHDRQRGALATAEWARFRTGAAAVGVGSRTAVLVGGEPAALVVVEEEHPAHKDGQAPRFHAREAAVARQRRRACLRLVGAAPSPEAWHLGLPIRRPPRADERRAWPQVEIVDRSVEPPGLAFLAPDALRAVRAAIDAGRRAVVFVRQAGFWISKRCTRCRFLRRCPACGAGAAAAPGVCARCGSPVPAACERCGATTTEGAGRGRDWAVAELRRLLPRVPVATGAAPDAQVLVAGEAELGGLGHDVTVGIVPDFDALLYAPYLRAAHEAFRLAVCVAGAVPPRDAGGRLLVQTFTSGHYATEALAHADAAAFAAADLEARRREAGPPFRQFAVLDVRGAGSADTAPEGVPGTLAGPLPQVDGVRWLCAFEPGESKALREPVRRLRAHGLSVRVDVDPEDVR